MSSPVFATAASRSGPTTSAIPLTSLAPPLPPVRTTTSPPVTTRAPRRSLPSLPQLPGQVGEPDARVDLVAGVHGYQQGGQRLGYARHLETPDVDAAKPIDPFDRVRRLAP